MAKKFFFATVLHLLYVIAYNGHIKNYLNLKETT